MTGAGRRYPDRPFVGVGIVVFRGSEVLLVKRARPPARPGWSIPGGAQELGETVAEAALRELEEETGVAAELTGLVDVVDAITRDEAARVAYHYTLVDVAAEWRSGEAVAGDDVAEVRWAPLREIERHVGWRETIRVIRKAASMRGRRGWEIE